MLIESSVLLKEMTRRRSQLESRLNESGNADEQLILMARISESKVMGELVRMIGARDGVETVTLTSEFTVATEALAEKPPLQYVSDEMYRMLIKGCLQDHILSTISKYDSERELFIYNLCLTAVVPKRQKEVESEDKQT